MSNITTTERGWAGHFILASRCNFRRNTLIEAEAPGIKTSGIKIVVSTVGAMETEPGGGYSTIGCNHYYETMVFHARKSQKKYWDVDVTRQIAFDSRWSIGYINEAADMEANNMHSAVVAEIIKRIKRGDMFKNGADYE